MNPPPCSNVRADIGPAVTHVAEWLRLRYAPAFRVGLAAYSVKLDRLVTPREACFAPDLELLDDQVNRR